MCLQITFISDLIEKISINLNNNYEDKIEWYRDPENTLKCSNILKEHSHYFSSLLYYKDGMIVSGSGDGTIKKSISYKNLFTFVIKIYFIFNLILMLKYLYYLYLSMTEN